MAWLIWDGGNTVSFIADKFCRLIYSTFFLIWMRCALHSSHFRSYLPCMQSVSQLEFNVPFQHGYIRDERSQFIEDTVEPSVFLPGNISLVIMCIGII